MPGVQRDFASRQQKPFLGSAVRLMLGAGRNLLQKQRNARFFASTVTPCFTGHNQVPCSAVELWPQVFVNVELVTFLLSRFTPVLPLYRHSPPSFPGSVPSGPLPCVTWSASRANRCRA